MFIQDDFHWNALEEVQQNGYTIKMIGDQRRQASKMTKSTIKMIKNIMTMMLVTDQNLSHYLLLICSSK